MNGSPFRYIVGTFSVIAASLALASCGGGGSITAGGGTGGTGISTGVMTKGSVIVNRVRFNDNNAQITIDDSPKAAADLRDGMVVKIRGTFNDDGLTGDAEKIRAADELEGPVTTGSVTADSFLVLGQPVLVDDRTIFANDGGLRIGALAGGAVVEVHGLRKAGGFPILATRIEVKNPGEEEIEVKGIVSGFTGGSTFQIGNLVVTFTPPPPAGFGNDVFVEVEGIPDGPLSMTAQKIEIEDLETIEFEAGEGEEVEVEGFVSRFTATPGDFFVNGRAVRTTISTRFEGGLASDLADDVRVEAEGRMSGSVMIVEKIEFKESVRIESNATGSTANSVTLLEKAVILSSQTAKIGFSDPAELVGEGVKVRGFLNPDGLTITATRIDRLDNPVGVDQNELQGPVAFFDGTARTLSIAGITVDASGPGVQFEGDDDTLLTPAQFFGLLTENRTIVEARGTFVAGTITADRIEIE